MTHLIRHTEKQISEFFSLRFGSGQAKVIKKELKKVLKKTIKKVLNLKLSLVTSVSQEVS
jgi:hypothetical protein